MNLKNEHELIVKAREFDQDALAEIYDSFSPGLFRYASRLLSDSDLAEECVADTFSRYLGALQVGHGPTNHLQAYLYRIAHNWITDFYRRHSLIMIELTETLESDEHEKPENKITASIQKQQLLNALRTLTPDQRQVVVLRFIDEWSIDEVAQTLQKPVGAVKALQHRALTSLRVFFKSEEKVSLNESR